MADVNKKTLLFLSKPKTRQILLAMKKRGFREGKWNGVGGKVEKGESLQVAAVREAKEEIEVEIDPNDLKEGGVIHFTFAGKPELTRDVHIFFTKQWEGDPVETEEMRPKWYAIDTIPYDEMWVDDRHWLPHMLQGKKIRARFGLSSSGEKILDKEVSLT